MTELDSLARHIAVGLLGVDFGGVGDRAVSDYEVSNGIVRCHIQVRENFSSANQLWDTATWIRELSRYTTVCPGDDLWMGTADGDMFPGDTIEVEISGIGTLRNYVVAEGS